MPPSYGHAYLTSYGWTGAGTGLRKGAISKPLAIPPKKNLSGLGQDRDEAFPFWDHLFTAASQAITIKVSSHDDSDDDPDAFENPPSQVHPASTSVPLRRTTTGIISNRQPISGTPVSTSGSTTPNPSADADIDVDVPDTHDDVNTGTTSRLSLMAIAKREAARRGLYARFFRGPVLGPDDDPRTGANTASHSASTSVDVSSVSTPVPDCTCAQDDLSITKEAKKSKKRKQEDGEETREERRERKKLRKELKAVRAAQKAEKAEKVKRKKERLGDVERRAKKQRDESSQSKKVRKSTAVPKGEQEDTARRSPTNVNATDSLNVVLTTKKKKAKRKHTPE